MIYQIKKNYGLFIINAVFLLVLLYMLPLRDQFLGDDWAAILSTRDFIQTGQLKLSDSMQVSAIFLILWGALFSAVFGFSIKILHTSVIVILFFAFNFFYLLLKRLGLGEIRAIFFTLILLFYPYTISYSYSFLTYIPDMSLVIISIYFYTRAIQERNNFNYLFGSAFAGLSMLTRQTGLAMFLAILMILVYRSFSTKRPSGGEFICALLPFGVLSLAYYVWLLHPDNMTIAQAVVLYYKSPENSMRRFIPVVLGHISITQTYYLKYLDRVTFYLHHLEEFLLPVFLMFTIKTARAWKFLMKYRRSIISVTIIYFIFMAIGFFYTGFQIIIDRPANEVFPQIPAFIFNFIGIVGIDWIKFFRFIVIISLFIWIPLIASSLNNIFSAVLSKRAEPQKKVFRNLALVGLGIFLFYYAKVLTLVFESKLKSYTDPLWVKISQYIDLIFSEAGSGFILHSWLVPTIMYLVFLGVIYLFFHYKLKKITDKSQLSLGFLFLSFCGQILFVVFLFYYQFPQYIIAFLPFVLIWIAFISRNWKLNLFKAILIIIIFLPLSLLPAKSRYESGGLTFEIANSLVKKGVSPQDIFVLRHERSWIPWWYSKDTYDMAIKEVGGDKYKITGLTPPWESIQAMDKDYGVEEVDVDFKESDLPNLEIIEDSGDKYIGIFTKIRGVGYKKR